MYKFQTFAALILLILFQSCLSLASSGIPPRLDEWKGWVLRGHEHELCTAGDGDARFCKWSGPISLELDEQGGRFLQEWTLEAGGWVFLPGSSQHWPFDVRTDDRQLTVVKHSDRPAVWFEKSGRYAVSGRFRWSRLPDALVLPEDFTIISSLVINGTMHDLIEISGGKLWFRSGGAGAKGQEVDQLDISVCRLIKDSVPMLIETRIDLQVAGRAREVVLGSRIPDDLIPLSLDAPIPARLEKDGRLRLKVRPGHWTVTLVTRSVGPVTELEPGKVENGPWSDYEYWVFEARPDLRVVSVSGVRTIDPSMTTIPGKWRKFPAYIVKSGERMILKERRRGNSDPVPDRLELVRTFWLDQNGRGVTVRDVFAGTVSRSWRLEAGPAVVLGRVTIDNQDQLITRLSPESPAGVEVRPGEISMTAVSRMQRGGPVQAAGWLHDLKKLSINLELPPGWKLMHVSGVDRADTWISRWTLFDIFIVLIIFLAVGRMYSWSAAFVSLVAMTLAYHEPEAPVMAWLALLAFAALRRVGQGNRFSRIITAAWYWAAGIIVLIIIPFSIQQVRHGIYPQLEKGNMGRIMSVGQDAAWNGMHTKSTDMEMGMGMRSDKRRMAVRKRMEKLKQAAPVSPSIYSRRLYRPDMQAKVQTGPGLPSWQWNHAVLAWNGPVDSLQTFNMYLLSPKINLLLVAARVIFLFAMAFFLIFREFLPYIRGKKGKAPEVAASVLLWAALFMALWSASPATAAVFPPQQILNELRARLLEPNACRPDCASLERMSVKIDDRGLMELRLTAGAVADTAIPLPRGAQWHVNFISLDSAEPLLMRHNSNIFIRLSEGRHEITMSGRIKNRTTQLFLPMKPHYVTVDARNWVVTGINPDGVPEQQLQLSLKAGDHEESSKFAAVSLPPFVKVTRTIRLGIEWHVETMVERLSPKGTPIILDIDLLPGESVITDGIKVKDGMARCSMGPGAIRFSWRSILAEQHKLLLIAPRTTRWVEEWVLEAEPLWHVDMHGIPVIFNESVRGTWFPRWQPWPGERVEISITRPRAVAGPTKTVDSTFFRIRPGLRITEASLTLTIRSSRGDRMTLRLPKGAVLESVLINGTPQAVRLQGREVALPVNPGRQQIVVSWRQPGGITHWFMAPKVDIGMDSVNNTVEIQPGSRWIWWLKGPEVGPAVLFYSEIAVLFFLSILLGMSGITPVKTWQWMLLAFGLSQSGLAAGGIVAAWFIALGVRERYGGRLRGIWFNLAQTVLVLLTFTALMALAFAIHNGLLGHPDMRIAGNASSAHMLRWYSDRVGGILPRPGVFSLSMFTYRVTMLLWALWLAASMIRWLRWGWNAYSSGRLWEKVNIRIRRGDED